MSATQAPEEGSTTSTAPPAESVVTSTVRAGWTVRDGTESDHALVLQTWLRCFFYDSAFAFKRPQRACRACHAKMISSNHHIPEDVFYSEHQKIAKRAISTGTLRCVVDPEAPDVIYGWMVHCGPILHFAYVKAAWRRQGVLRALMADLPRDFIFTHRTPDFEPVLRRLPLGPRYIPYPMGGAP